MDRFSTSLTPEEYLAAGSEVGWPLPSELLDARSTEYRNRFARKLATRPVAEIIESYVHCSVNEMERLVCLAERHALDEPLSGVGIELGAGTALLASVVARRPAVRGVLAVEVCETVARRVAPQVAREVLGTQADKVVPIVGSFDDLRLPDACLDFAIEIDSLHHSDNLARTLGEAARVLREGATMLCFDRCHSDTIGDEEVAQMLDRVYSREFLIQNGYPADVVLTRRENGEHEYRLFEWKSAFEQAGLILASQISFRPRLKLSHAVKGLASAVGRWSRRPRMRRYDPGLAWQYVLERLGAGSHTTARGLQVVAPKKTTIFVLQKRTARGDCMRAA